LIDVILKFKEELAVKIGKEKSVDRKILLVIKKSGINQIFKELREDTHHKNCLRDPSEAFLSFR
jgi:hypothetical protein